MFTLNKKNRQLAFILSSMLLLPLTAQAGQSVFPHETFKTVGEGKMKWMFISLKGSGGLFGTGLSSVSDGSLLFLTHLMSKKRDTKRNDYRVRLMSKNGAYQPSSYPMALEINYLKSMSASALLESTDGELKRLGIDRASRTRWLASLERILPSVKSGDRLTVLAHGKNKGTFYFNDQAIGDINDRGLAGQFLSSIGLSEKTSQPRLRQQLIGNQ